MTLIEEFKSKSKRSNQMVLDIEDCQDAEITELVDAIGDQWWYRGTRINGRRYIQICRY